MGKKLAIRLSALLVLSVLNCVEAVFVKNENIQPQKAVTKL